jgi:lipopolysaccharide biosynthesis glycosyltransferase
MSAYITLVMKQPHYINGAMVLAYSLKQTETKHDIVCMITADMFEYKEMLLNVFDKVVTVQYLQYYTPDLKTQKQNDIYVNWKDISFTKWNCLNLPYDKVCFLDADLIVQKNIDHLFNLQAPAGCFGNNWSSHVDYYSNVEHGKPIPDMSINKGLTNGYLVNGHCIILEPNAKLFRRFIEFMKMRKYTKNYKCLSMVDEVALIKFMVTEDKHWTQICAEYNCVPWKNGTDAYILHYFNKEKPWMSKSKINKWPDLKIWFAIWDKICDTHPNIKLVK